MDARHALAAFGVRVAPVATSTNRAAFPAAAIAGPSQPSRLNLAARPMRALWRVVEKELNDEKAHPAKRAGTKGGPARPPARSPEQQPAKKVADDGRMSTSLRIEPERLEALKIIALRERVRVNELVLRGIDHIIALHNQGRVA